MQDRRKYHLLRLAYINLKISECNKVVSADVIFHYNAQINLW